MYSELDDNHRELRKVEMFADGRHDFSSNYESKGDARLSVEPIPSLDEISLDPQFEPIEISKEEFEDVWNTAHYS